MSRRTHVDLEHTLVEKRYATKAQIVIDTVAPKSLGVIGGRGTAKTTVFMARRSMDVCYDMPGSYLALVSDTYVNAMANVVPTLIDGWKREGWRENIHFITDKRPPAHFKTPYKPPLTFKHTISTVCGNLFQLGSLDQPSGLAGNSYQHIFGDEARLLKFEKLKRINPAIRGEYERFHHSPYYRGRTFMTDMPNLLSGDEDWIWDMQKEMDPERAQLALQVGMVLNEIKLEMVNAAQAKDHKEYKRLYRHYKQWKEKWYATRKDLTLFYVISTLANADVLTDGYFFDTLASLGPEEFKSAVLSLRVNIKQGEKFYSHLGQHHFYEDGINTDFYKDKYSLTDTIQESSLALRYVDHNKKMECGIDFGDMISMVTGQHRGNYIYCLKDFHTLAPESSRELGKQFVNFYKNHKRKELDMYYDRSGNQYRKLKRDWASEVKRSIEYVDGSKTGWTVNLKNVGQGNITQEEEFNFARQLMGEAEKELPKLKIDTFGCKHLKSSLELTKTVVKTDTNGTKRIYKDKSSEKLPLASRPMFSTNFSDAFKYFIYRPDFTQYVKRSDTFTGIAPGVY